MVQETKTIIFYNYSKNINLKKLKKNDLKKEKKEWVKEHAWQ